jgi:hypothetical protein
MSSEFSLLILLNGQMADRDADGGYRRFIRQIPNHDSSVKLAEFGDEKSGYPFKYGESVENVISAYKLTKPTIIHCTPWSIRRFEDGKNDIPGIMVSGLDKYDGKKWIDVEDSQDIEYIFPYMRLFTGVLYRYESHTISNILKTKFPDHSYYHLPHSLSPQVFKNWNLEKKYDITFIAARNNLQDYPFRWRVFNLLYSTGSFSIQYLNSAELCNQEAYSQALNSSWLCMATPTIYKHENDDRYTGYFFRKFVEIPMSGSIVLGYVPPSAEDDFNNCYVKITEGMTDDEIVQIIKDSLADKDNLKKMSDELQSKFSQKYSYEQIFKEMIKALKNSN